jgi:hypothetical protein
MALNKIPFSSKVAKASALGVITTQALGVPVMIGTAMMSAVEQMQSTTFPVMISFGDENDVLATESSPSIPMFDSERKWGRTEKRRFDDLLFKQIKRTINQNEKKELADLMFLRRQKVPSRTADEIMRSAQRQKLITEMNDLLNRYVKISTGNQRNKATWYPKKTQSA